MLNADLFSIFLESLTPEKFLLFVTKSAHDQLADYIGFLETNFQKNHQIVLN